MPFAFRNGKITQKQLDTEAALHQKCGKHPNLIEFYATGHDDVWMWIAMEYASGGDLFDKIGRSCAGQGLKGGEG